MPSHADNVILTFPPRPVSQWERALVAEWFVVTQREGAGITRAFVSERRGDDPKIVGRIVIIARPSKEPTHLVDSPAELAFWVVTVAPDWNERTAVPDIACGIEVNPPRVGSARGHTGHETTGTLLS